jgi:redox-sensitive bicupin YhaK (pirin superfamily)
MVVHRAFPREQEFDPFLLLDEMGPLDIAAGEDRGFPDHPHRGFETVTYVLEGNVEHLDSRGHHGNIGPGDVQWMTAGSGLVHSEMPAAEIRKKGGRLHGFQLWVNLPRRDKLMAPRYQEIPAASIPTAQSADGRIKVKVIAGEALGARAAIETRTPIIYQHWELEPGAGIEQPVPQDYRAFAYVFEGQGIFGTSATAAKKEQMVVFSGDGQSVKFANPPGAKSTLKLLLLAGVPLGEPIAHYGPFVMNTEEELHQAFHDYRSGKLGTITRSGG